MIRLGLMVAPGGMAGAFSFQKILKYIFFDDSFCLFSDERCSYLQSLFNFTLLNSETLKEDEI
jgi:hypothetical protein